jgi:hypothetical protein
MLFREGDGAEEEAGKKAKPSSVQVQNILDYSYFEEGKHAYFLWLCLCSRDKVCVSSTHMSEKIVLCRIFKSSDERTSIK